MYSCPRLLTEEQFVKMPYYLNLYLQLAFNAVLIGGLCWTFWKFFQGIQNDIHSKVQLHSRDVMDRISMCAHNYRENRCEPEYRVPALEKACTEWESCMTMDSGIVDKRSQLSAQTIGEVVNAFLEQLSWKSAILLAAGFVVIVVGSNVAFTLSRWMGDGTRRPERHTKPSYSERNDDFPRYSDRNDDCPRYALEGRKAMLDSRAGGG
eukprot:Selendium_serpulae@DN6482_c0_g1_i11.p1